MHNYDMASPPEDWIRTADELGKEEPEDIPVECWFILNLAPHRVSLLVCTQVIQCMTM